MMFRRGGFGFWPGHRRNAGGGGPAPISGFVAAVRGSITGTSLTLTVPEGVQAGDCAMMAGVSSNVPSSNEVAPGSGWSTPVNTAGFSFAHRVHDGSATLTFTVPSSVLFTVMLVFVRGGTFGKANTAWSGLAANPVPADLADVAANSLNFTFVGAINSGVMWGMTDWTSRSAGNANRSSAAFERNVRVSGAVAGVAAVRNAGGTNGRALQAAITMT
jgi:hypothetical protein